MILADYHVHSVFSTDSNTPMEHMIEKALQLGLKRLCFTDHMDYDYPNPSEFIFDPEVYFDQIQLLRERYKDKIEVLAGIELGLQPHLSERLSNLTRQYSFDFIIGSSHVVDHWDPYYPEYWENRSNEDGIRRYYESIIENCKAYQGFHVYGHLDYIIRYVPTTTSKSTSNSYSDYAELLDEVLKTIISYGKGIEINTAGLKYGLDYAHPIPDVLKRYKELGGELITIGSDAHKPEHLCYDFHVIPSYLKELGFQYYANFVEGKPVFEKLS